MGEILFKAKSRKKSDVWVEGYYCKMDETTKCFDYDYDQNSPKTLHFIIEETMTDWGLPNEFVYREVIPETLCRFTGLIKDGKKIWENDVIQIQDFRTITGIVKFGEYDNGHYGFYVDWIGDDSIVNGLAYWTKRKFELVGNVYDNPDVIEIN